MSFYIRFVDRVKEIDSLRHRHSYIALLWNLDRSGLRRCSNVEMGEAERILLRHNLIIYKAISTIAREDVKPDKEIGIGEYYAWQIPLYRDVLKKILGV